ncbi:MAG TPA: hypothetical protein VF813_12495 [Anaerolineaceae bacterium]
MTEVDSLKQQLEAKEAELLKVKLELIESKIVELQQADADKELRLRAVEISRTRFETLAWLACGGGAMSLINILLKLK